MTPENMLPPQQSNNAPSGFMRALPLIVSLAVIAEDFVQREMKRSGQTREEVYSQADQTLTTDEADLVSELAALDSPDTTQTDHNPSAPDDSSASPNP